MYIEEGHFDRRTRPGKICTSYSYSSVQEHDVSSNWRCRSPELHTLVTCIIRGFPSLLLFTRGILWRTGDRMLLTRAAKVV
jgi:hypothetical protein